MKMLGQVFLSLFLFHITLVQAAVPRFIPRSVSVNAARELVGWQELINLCDYDSDWYHVLSITPEFTQTFRGKRLARCLLGSDVQCDEFGNTIIKVSGSQVPNRGAHDWLADYFVLAPDWESTIILNPQVRNFLVDLNYYIGFDAACSGLFFRIHTPLVHTRWNLQATELIDQEGATSFLPGYFGSQPKSSENGTALGALAGTSGDSNFFSLSCFDGTITANAHSRISFPRLQHSRWQSGVARLTRIGDIEAELGWNFWCDDCSLVGLGIRVSAPTGNRINDQFFFSPVIGDGHHWKLGVGMNAQKILWQEDDCKFGVYFQGNVQHLFNDCQLRSFDLCGKPNSRYMIAQKLGTTRLSVHINSEAADAGVEFQNAFSYVADLTHAKVNVSVGAEVDLAVKFAYMTPCWSVDIGYEFWSRGCEKICRRKGSTALADGQTWALKGDAFIIGFADSNTGECVRLAAVQADATINSGTNNFVSFDVQEGGIGGVPPFANPGISNPQVLINAVDAGFPPAPTNVLGQPLAGPFNAVTRSSNPVIFLTENDIDFSGTSSMSNKLFAHWNYTWDETCCGTPFLGLGGEIEFGVDSCGSCNKKCQRCSLDQWGIWLKGGLAFN